MNLKQMGIVSALWLVACGGGSGVAPTISNLKMSSTTVSPGDKITGTMRISDPDGLGGMSVSLSISGPISAQSSTPVQGASDALTEADVPFFVSLSALAPTGVYSVTMTATDADGNTSNALTAEVTVK
jgi:hypothetical protein